MERIENLKEAMALAHMYESLHEDDIDDVMNEYGYQDPVEALRDITGFGNPSTCTLCKASKDVCRECIYVNDGSGRPYLQCLGDNYDAIEDAVDSEDLIVAIRERAEYLNNLIKQYKEHYEE